MDRSNRADIVRKIIYFAAAVLLLAILAGWTFPDRQAKLVRTEYPVVILGDSIMGLCRDETSVSELLQKALGKPVFNGALGGTCMVRHDREDADYTTELLNMVSLSKAIAADDFGVQQTMRSRRVVTDYFEYAIDDMECIDFHKVDTLILEFGINDYHAGAPVDNGADPFDEFSYGGALRSVLRTLQKAYPGMRIILATPTFAWYCANGLTCEEYDTGSAFLEAYVEKELEIAEEFQVEIVDLYHDIYPHETWEDWMQYTEDGIHPNEEGRRLIAEILAEKIGR